MHCDELRSSDEAGVDDRIEVATSETQAAQRRSAAVVNGRRVPSWTMSSLTSLVTSIDERLAALRGEIDRLQQSRAALTSNAALVDGAGLHARRAAPAGRPARAIPAPRATVVRAASKAAPRPRPQTRAARPAKPPAQRSGRARRHIAPLTAAAIEQLLSGRDTGLSARAIAEQATADYAATLSLLRELEASGQVRREGSRRTTAWRLITDEDRIAQRAAELDRLAATSGTRQARAPGRARASR